MQLGVCHYVIISNECKDAPHAAKGSVLDWTRSPREQHSSEHVAETDLVAFAEAHFG